MKGAFVLQGLQRLHRWLDHHRAYGPMNALIIATMLSAGIPACRSKDTVSLDQRQVLAIQDSVRSLSISIARDITREGPNAWLSYFERSPHFFMASEGALAFPNNDSADTFVHGLSTWVRSIELSWSDLRIDPLTADIAVMAASFHEVLTDTSGHKISEEGYFTAIAEQTSGRWLLRNAHWSIPGPRH
jgi:hypothetical protein